MGPVILDEAFSETFRVRFRVRGRKLQGILVILSHALEGKRITVSSLQAELGVSERTLYKYMKDLQGWRILAFQGPPRTGSYRLTEDGRHIVRDINQKAQKLRQT